MSRLYWFRKYNCTSLKAQEIKDDEGGKEFAAYNTWTAGTH